MEVDAGGDTPDAAVLHEVLERDGLVLVRGLQPKAEIISEAAAMLGEVRPTEYYVSVPGHPGVTEVSHQPTSPARVLGGSWHADLAFLAEPPRYGLILGVETPTQGAATLFASRSLALSRVSSATTSFFESLQCTFSGEHVFGPNGSYADGAERSPSSTTATTELDLPRDTHRPLIATYGEVRSLTFDPGYCTSVSPLHEAEAFTVWRWLETIVTAWDVLAQAVVGRGDLLVWDNRVLLHRAPRSPSGPRSIFRANVWERQS